VQETVVTVGYKEDAEFGLAQGPVVAFGSRFKDGRAVLVDGAIRCDIPLWYGNSGKP